MLRIVSAALFALLVWGCAPDTRSPIPDSTMVNVMVELHLLNARMDLSGRPIEHARDSILHGYGIDSASYEGALHYYAEHPVEYGAIYGQVVDALASEPTTLPDSASSDPVPQRPSP